MTRTYAGGRRAQVAVSSTTATSPTEVFEYTNTQEGRLGKVLLLSRGNGDCTVTLWLYSVADDPGAGVAPGDELLLTPEAIELPDTDALDLEELRGVPLYRGDKIVGISSLATGVTVLIGSEVKP